MMAFTLISITTELFLSPARHRPWGPGGSIPLSHMNRMEHATIALSFFVYAVVALAVDKLEISAPAGLVQAVAAVGFAQELLLFHFHSSSAVGLEKHYHWLFQAVVGACLGSTLAEAAWPEKALAALLRAAAVTMQGVWLLHMAFVLWIPAAIPSGCELQSSKNVFVAKCSTREATERAIAMANLYFTWDLLLVVLVTIVVLFYNSHTVCSVDNVCNPRNKIEGYQALDFKEYDMESLQRYCRSCRETAQSESDHDDVHQ
ncbi:hypothetical protein SUGI_0896260 [Cryptomeria japonica]|nr:hypothetical protein SUGI_0896260 [Cryptomeria japonica]